MQVCFIICIFYVCLVTENLSPIEIVQTSNKKGFQVVTCTSNITSRPQLVWKVNGFVVEEKTTKFFEIRNFYDEVNKTMSGEMIIKHSAVFGSNPIIGCFINNNYKQSTNATIQLKTSKTYIFSPFLSLSF